jgi:hypothetical protein
MSPTAAEAAAVARLRAALAAEGAALEPAW